MCKFAIKKMLKKYGKIINITSIVGHTETWAKQIMASAGIIAFSKLIFEYAKKNINRINCVSPGFIKTDMTDKINEEFKQILINKIPSGDLGTGEDVSNCVAFARIWLSILMAKLYMLMVECIWLDNSNY